MYFKLNDKQLINQQVVVAEINVKIEDLKRLERIGLYINNHIQLANFKPNNITIFIINNISYAIRDEIAKNIVVKKVC